jgi:alpha-L-fucosidase
MEAIGKWLEKNGYAIYGTRPLYPYCEGNIRYTQSKDGKHQYAITLTDEAPYATVKELKGKKRK